MKRLIACLTLFAVALVLVRGLGVRAQAEWNDRRAGIWFSVPQQPPFLCAVWKREYPVCYVGSFLTNWYQCDIAIGMKWEPRPEPFLVIGDRWFP